MKFLCLYKPGHDDGRPPSPEDYAKMGKLIDEMTKAGVLLDTGGCEPSSKGFRMRLEGGKTSMTDGPFPETKELIAGFAVIVVKTRAEAVEWTKRFLAVAGQGESEVRQMHEMPGA
jgi:hypothetical protein